MNCPKCGLEINPGEDYCEKCDSKDLQNTLLYQEEISTPDSNNTSNKIKTTKTKVLHFIIIFVLLFAILLSVGYGSYYVSFSKFTSEALEKSKKNAEKKNKNTSSDEVISKEAKKP